MFSPLSLILILKQGHTLEPAWNIDVRYIKYKGYVHTESCPAMLMHLSTVATVTLALLLHYVGILQVEMKLSVREGKTMRPHLRRRQVL